MLIDHIQLFSRVYMTTNIGPSLCNSVCTICKFTSNGRSFLVYFYRYISWYFRFAHYNGVTKSAIGSQITGVPIVCSAFFFRRRSKNTSKLCVTGLCQWNSPVAGEFPAQRASNAGHVSIRWRHRVIVEFISLLPNVHDELFWRLYAYKLLNTCKMHIIIPWQVWHNRC